MKKTQQNGLTELEQRCRASQGEKRAGTAGFPGGRFPTVSYLDGRQVLEVAVRVRDQAWRAVPPASRVNPDLTLLVSGQELGSIGTEMSWQSEKPLSSGDPRWALGWPSQASCRGTSLPLLSRDGWQGHDLGHETPKRLSS